MYRLGVISDSHGDTGSLRRAAIQLADCDAIAFLGDIEQDAAFLSSVFPKTIYAVRGNNDFSTDLPGEVVIEREGHRLLVTHGHKWRVKFELHSLMYRAMELSCDAALFGHTHAPMSDLVNGVMLLNPGACSGANATCAVIEFRENGLSPRIYRVR